MSLNANIQNLNVGFRDAILWDFRVNLWDNSFKMGEGNLL